MTAIGLTYVGEVIFQGDSLAGSGIVTTSDVYSGMLLMTDGNGNVKPATPGAEVRGIAYTDAKVGEEVTYMYPNSDFIARMVLAESQTIHDGDSLIVASSSISGITYNGQVGKMTDQTFTAGGATGAEVGGFRTQLRGFVGKALMDCSTGADENKVIKVLFKGAQI